MSGSGDKAKAAASYNRAVALRPTGRSRAQRSGARRRLVDRSLIDQAAFWIGSALTSAGRRGTSTSSRDSISSATIGAFRARAPPRHPRADRAAAASRAGISAGGVRRRGSSALPHRAVSRCDVLIVGFARWRRDHDRRRQRAHRGRAVTTRGASATRGASWIGRPLADAAQDLPLPRSRSIAARARSLASRRSSGATAASTGAVQPAARRDATGAREAGPE